MNIILESMTHCHAQRLIAGRHFSTSFIRDSDNEIQTALESYIAIIWEKFHDTCRHVVFSLGIDATVIMKSYQFSPYLGAIVH